MKLRNIVFVFCSVLFCFFTVSCNQDNTPPIGDNISFPSSLKALDSSHLVMLNSSANGDYTDGSIQSYSVTAGGDKTLLRSYSVPKHGLDIAVSEIKSATKVVALSFDGSVTPTQMKFYDYTDPSAPIEIPVTLNLPESGGVQAVKFLHFFEPTGAAATDFYFYGVIYSYAQNDGTFDNIPPRVFVGKLSYDKNNLQSSTANVLFTLSYGVNDPVSLFKKSDSSNYLSYSFGSTAPTYDAAHDLLIAFPTGAFASDGGVSSGSLIPSSIFEYLEKSTPTGGRSEPYNKNECLDGTSLTCLQPDIRTISLIAVNFSALNLTTNISSLDLNKNTYFAPLVWNANGVPYGGEVWRTVASTTSDHIPLTKASLDAQSPAPSEANNGNLTSLSFQTGFWTSYWLNTKDPGNGFQGCYTTSAQTSTNKYNIDALGGNALLVSKMGNNGGDDILGKGDEIFQIAGLDILKSSIDYIGGSISTSSDFIDFQGTQILDKYNTSLVTPSASWLNGVSPIIPYIYSRTTGVSDFTGNATSPMNFGVLNLGSFTCRPFWIRDTYTGLGSWGMDSAWLTASPNAAPAAQDLTYGYPDLVTAVVKDPTKPFTIDYPTRSGAELCTSIKTSTNPYVYCVNFITGGFTRYSTTPGTTTFTKF